MQQRPPPSPAVSRRSGGFALIIVLWTLVLIAFIVAQLVGSGRTEIRIAGNLLTNAVTEAAADGAAFQAIFDLLEPSADQRWPLDGTAREFAMADCRVMVQVEDEAGRINPNLASPALLEALLRAAGSDPDGARRLAAAIGEWVAAPGVARPQEALLAQYRAAGLDYVPPGEPLETVGELQRVLGMTPPLFDAIRPHLSLFAPAEPNIAHADPVVKAVVGALGLPEPTALQPAAQQSNPFTARIAVIAQGPNNARASRALVVRIVPLAGSYTILAWRNEAD